MLHGPVPSADDVHVTPVYSRVPAAPTQCSTAFARTVDGKKFATCALPYINVHVLTTWPRAPYCSMLPARGRTWREVKRTTEIPQHRLQSPCGNIEYWGVGIASHDSPRVGSCAEAVCVDRRPCCEIISINRRPGHQDRCFQRGRCRLGCCSRSGCWPPEAH